VYEDVGPEKIFGVFVTQVFVDVKVFQGTTVNRSGTWATSERAEFQNILSTQSYMYSITQITSMNFSFLETFKTDALMPIFDLIFCRGWITYSLGFYFLSLH
jgi:hypothetical protein